MMRRNGNLSSRLRLTGAILFFCTCAAGAEWQILFDGHNTRAWRSAGSDSFPDSWTVRDGVLRTVSTARMRQDLWTREAYSNFELAFQWRLGRGGNTGVKYLIQNWVQGYVTRDRITFGELDQKLDVHGIRDADQFFETTIGFEYQLIDDASADATDSPAHVTSALYEYLAPQVRPSVPNDTFHSSRLVVKGNHVEHWRATSMAPI